MSESARPLTDVMAPVWILHHCELLFIRYQHIRKNFGSFVVNIIIARSVHDQKLAGEARSMRHGRAAAVVLFVVLWQSHVSLLINRVIEMLVGYRRDRHSHLVNVRIAKHLVESHRAAAAPAPDRNPFRIYKGPALDHSGCCRLFFSSQHTNFSIDDFAPGAAFRRRSAANVKAHHDVSMLSQHLMPEVAS